MVSLLVLRHTEWEVCSASHDSEVYGLTTSQAKDTFLQFIVDSNHTWILLID
jgi:hypothetical protein